MRPRLFVLGLLFLAGVNLFGQQLNLNTPDSIFYNGKIVTVDSGFSIQQAFAVRGDQFIAVGTTAKIKAMAGKSTRLVDLKGSTVIPGLSDNHDHLYNAGKYLRGGVDLVGVTTLPEMLSRIKQGVAAAKPGETVFTTTGWAVRPGPTRKDLDQISMDVPIVVIGSRRGTGMLNGAALKLAGITGDTTSYLGSPVKKDAAGEPSGVIPDYPASVQLIDKLLPPLTDAVEDEIIRKGEEERSALGITSIRELQAWPPAVRAYYRLWRQNKLTLRLAMGIEFPDQAGTARELALLGVGSAFGDHWMRLDAVGEEPWPPAFPTKPYTEIVTAMDELGWRPTPHVSADGDRSTSDDATEAVLSAYEAADRVSPIKGKRWVVEHVPFATPAQLDRMEKLGLVISIQYAGYLNGQQAIETMGKDRAEHQNPVREYLDHRLVVIGGSDYSGPKPDEALPNNPLIPYYFYVTRKARTGEIVGGDEKISRAEALRIFTTNSAYATFEEKAKGSIQPGMLADFVVLNQDLLTVPDDKILATHPLATYVGGNKVFSAPSSNF